ncbi:MAG: hypothetical protein K0S32_2595 [Bacteroidetes bacterium]|jgi:hypothetical protein|nr:hypothetical protein [Bacteroidota bacterium]
MPLLSVNFISGQISLAETQLHSISGQKELV